MSVYFDDFETIFDLNGIEWVVSGVVISFSSPKALCRLPTMIFFAF